MVDSRINGLKRARMKFCGVYPAVNMSLFRAFWYYYYGPGERTVSEDGPGREHERVDELDSYD